MDEKNVFVWVAPQIGKETVWSPAIKFPVSDLVAGVICNLMQMEYPDYRFVVSINRPKQPNH